MLGICAFVVLVLTGHAVASTVQDVDAEEVKQNGETGDSCSGVVLLQMQTQMLKKQDFDRESPQHVDLAAKMQATDHAERLQGKDIARRGRKDIIWFHLHNMGGSTMCAEARNQGENTSDKIGANCNVHWDGVSGCASLEAVKQGTCRSNCSSRVGYSYSSVERALTEEDIHCNDKLYGVTLRDPISTARSTYVNDHFDDEAKQNMFSAIRNRDPGIVLGISDTGVLGSHGTLPHWDSYQHFDNFATRTLSGDYMVSPGMMERKHLEKAKSRLQKMDVVMILEDLSQHSVQLEAVFGWTLTDEFGKKKANSHAHDQLTEAFTNDEERFLRSTNHLDYELLQFGASLAANRSAAARMHRGLS
jgi:hypothetical protein